VIQARSESEKETRETAIHFLTQVRIPDQSICIGWLDQHVRGCSIRCQRCRLVTSIVHFDRFELFPIWLEAGVPFFPRPEYGVAIHYVSHAEHCDSVGAMDNNDCTVTCWRDGVLLALAAVGQDPISLEAELAVEQQQVP
jgi:hypothetical protein